MVSLLGRDLELSIKVVDRGARDLPSGSLSNAPSGPRFSFRERVSQVPNCQNLQPLISSRADKERSKVTFESQQVKLPDNTSRLR